jgi:hypothetical protein
MQVYDGVGSRYNSLIAGFRTITREEGYKALYKVASSRLTNATMPPSGYRFDNVCDYSYDRACPQACSPPPCPGEATSTSTNSLR